MSSRCHKYEKRRGNTIPPVRLSSPRHEEKRKYATRNHIHGIRKYLLAAQLLQKSGSRWRGAWLCLAGSPFHSSNSQILWRYIFEAGGDTSGLPPGFKPDVSELILCYKASINSPTRTRTRTTLTSVKRSYTTIQCTSMTFNTPHAYCDWRTVNWRQRVQLHRSCCYLLDKL